MKKGEGLKTLAMNNARITRLSILLVIVIFLLQVFLLYNFYKTNINLLQRELNLSLTEIYKADLDARLKKITNKEDPNIQFLGTSKPDNIDSSEYVKIESMSPSMNVVSKLNMAMEEYVSEIYPLNLHDFDSIASIKLKLKGIDLSFYTEVVDVKTQKVLEASSSARLMPVAILQSDDFYINMDHSKALRIILINPLSGSYFDMGMMLIGSALLCLICIYSFYFHRKTLSKQKELAQTKNDLFSDLSHEFKKPLSILRQITSAFENEEMLKDKEKRSYYLRKANVEISKMSTQTEMILSMAMDDEGFFKLYPSEFDLLDLVVNVIESSEMPDNIEITVDMRNTGVYADRDHIGHVLSNLIGNAIKYTNPPVKIAVKLYRDNKNVYFSVRDNGIGISGENLPQIFERYSRIEQTKVKAKGHGIGLNYVKRIVEKHGGVISVVSEPEKGSEFTVCLPQLDLELKKNNF